MDDTMTEAGVSNDGPRATPTDTTEARSAFTVKNLKVSTREAAIRAARKQGLTMGEWLDKAIHNQIELEHRNALFPPFTTKQLHEATAPVQLAIDTSAHVYGGKPVPTVALVPLDQLNGLLNAATQLAALTGEPTPRNTVSGLKTMVANQIRAARGLPPLKVRERELAKLPRLKHLVEPDMEPGTEPEA